MGLLSEIFFSKEFENKWPWGVETDPQIYFCRESWPRISIITPSFNQCSYIEETIRSIVLQNYPNLEYIIIDGGSTDSSLEIIKRYENQITYWVSEPDKGQSQAINKGLKLATGELFNWINSDDYLAPNALFQIAVSFINYEPLVICGQTILLQNNTKEISKPFIMGIEKTTVETFAYPLINQPGTFFQTSILKEIGFINESMHFVMDLEFWRRFLAFYGIERVFKTEKLFAYFRYHDHSKSTVKPNSFTSELLMLNLYLAKRLSYPDYYIKYLNKQIVIFNHYVPSFWDFSSLNTLKLKSIQVRDFLMEVYNQGNRKQCRSYLKLYPGFNIPFSDYCFLKLYLKVILLPKTLEHFIRRMIKPLKSL